LLALIAGLGRSVFPVALVTPVALAVDEGRDDAAELAAGRLAVLHHVLLALFADGGRTAFTEICYLK